jgi:hypothetical protein
MKTYEKKEIFFFEEIWKKITKRIQIFKTLKKNIQP